ncbi:MAG TPA: EboA domain-containing protein [Kofleriaceae bacterium]|jgi:hypothetical protein|nr:EboA domain-containing protein [Kofleriaceae bacterium]
MAIVSELVDAVARAAPPDAVAWLAEQLVIDPTRFGSSFAAAGRKLGQAAVTATPPDIAWPATAGVDECGRGALVLAAIATMAVTEHVGFIRDLIRRGDARERQAVLRVLAALPEPARFVEIGIDACRTNVRSVFDAIACDNAFPAQQFPDAAFFQMVLKALFVEAPLARIVGLERRTTPELVRMVDAYASERRAAGRSVPDDVKLVKS